VSAPAVETLLARLYADADFRRAFLLDPKGVALGAGLDAAEAAAIAAIDRTGLEMAAESYRRKRMGR
jgi:hypothetical protein